jgi:hypothetical protein
MVRTGLGQTPQNKGKAIHPAEKVCDVMPFNITADTLPRRLGDAKPSPVRSLVTLWRCKTFPNVIVGSALTPGTCASPSVSSLPLLLLNRLPHSVENKQHCKKAPSTLGKVPPKLHPPPLPSCHRLRRDQHLRRYQTPSLSSHIRAY